MFALETEGALELGSKQSLKYEEDPGALTKADSPLGRSLSFLF